MSAKKVVGTLRSNDATATRTSLNVNLRSFSFYVSVKSKLHFTGT